MPDTSKVKTFLQICEQYKNMSNYVEAKEFGEKALSISTKINFKEGIIDALNQMGTIYTILGDYSKALDFQFKALKIADSTQNKRNMAATNKAIGIIYWYEGNYPKALEYYLRAQRLQEILHDTLGISNSLNNIGLIYRNMGNKDKALEFYKQALGYEEKTNNVKGIGNTLNNIGVVYHLNNDFSSALHYFSSALEIRKKRNDKVGISTSLSNIGSTYLSMKNYPKAVEYLKMALGISKEIDDLEGVKVSCDGLYQIYFEKKDGNNALKYFKEYINARDSLVNEESKRNAERQELQYEHEKEKIEFRKEQEKQKAIAGAEKKKQQLIIICITSGLIMMLLFVVFLFNRFQVTKRQKRIIEKQKIIVDEKNKNITDSINYAKRIQRALLASDYLLKKNLPDFFVLYKPKDIVSGDFYWANTIENKFLLIIADCTGHGVPGAFMSLLNISFLNEATIEKKISSPDLTLHHVREQIVSALNPEGTETEGKDGMDCVLCSFDFKKNSLEFACANNPLWILRDNQIIQYKPDKIPVGMQTGEKQHFTLQKTILQKGDTIYAFTDGYADQFGGPNGKKFKYKQLEEKLLAVGHLSLQEQKNMLEKTFDEWKGNLEQIDDVLMIGIKI